MFTSFVEIRLSVILFELEGFSFLRLGVKVTDMRCPVADNSKQRRLPNAHHNELLKDDGTLRESDETIRKLRDR
jgi:hypothetical protein